MARSLFALAALALITGLIFLGHPAPSPVEDTPDHILEVRARVTAVDNTGVWSAGHNHMGAQSLNLILLEGPFKGQRVEAVNPLTGHSDMETLFQREDTIIAAVILDKGEIVQVNAVDLVRQDSLLLLFGLFVVSLIAFARMVGVRALVSFVLTIGIIWKFLVPRLLAGAPPLPITALTLVLLSGLVIFLVAGINRRGITAFLGTLGGLGVSLATLLVFGGRTGLHGMTQPHVNALLFSGYYTLDIRGIFYAAVILGASGAAMDVAMDVAAAMDEIKKKKPGIAMGELTASGLTVGRQVIGTMATTLLLAYSGGYLTLLLFFQAQHPSTLRILNLKIVAAEIMRTLVGSMGLIMVAPLTALVGGILLGRFSSRS